MHEEKKNYLKKARVLYKLICSYEEELLEHRLIIGCAPIGCYEQVVGRSSDQHANPIEPAVIKILEYEELIRGKIAEYIEIKAKISNAIDLLNDDTEKLVLRLKYINGKTHEEISQAIGYVERQVIRIYEKALENFKIPLNCQ